MYSAYPQELQNLNCCSIAQKSKFIVSSCKSKKESHILHRNDFGTSVAYISPVQKKGAIAMRDWKTGALKSRMANIKS
jgi:hypothetical protein